jgi:Ni/Co efflux regulator RcnB
MKFIKELLYLQKSDRKVILTLLVVILVALGVIFLTGGENDTTNGLVSADSANLRDRWRDSDRVLHHGPDSKIRERTVYVRTKVIYRDTAYQRGRRLAQTEYDSIKVHHQPKIHQGEYVVLNTADTTQLKTVPGIGAYFARKIVQYGLRLGGYVSVDQLDEIEDFPLDAKEYFTIEKPSRLRSLVLFGLARFGAHTRSTKVNMRRFTHLEVEFVGEEQPPCQIDGEELVAE